MDFSQRATLTELMDEACSFEEFRACLQEDVYKRQRINSGIRR